MDLLLILALSALLLSGLYSFVKLKRLWINFQFEEEPTSFELSRHATIDSCEVPPRSRKIGSGEGETSLSSSISKNDYEVFLSFRGPDTRQGFTDCLYHTLIDAGISVFRDDDELPLGSKIDEILHGLDNSKICIVVLSPNFAESSWCLREVERMVDMKKDIVPIFYHVTPDDVKLKTELYANALLMHETKYGKEQVQQWMDALKQIQTIKGQGLKNTGYIEFSRQITKEILTKLNVKHKYEIKNLVGVPDELESALKLLDIGSNDGRRFVGIHGMGGIGKTTLAKIIFNQILDRFDCSCFLENIRDYPSQGPDGLHKLQERLLKSLVPSMQDITKIVDPMKRIQTNFQRKKVVIVLDDVDQQSHLDSLVGDSSWFGEGSRIIFTTRNAEFHEQMTSSDARFYGLEKKEMDSKQALILFSRHAFGEDSPPKDFESLSTEAISTMGGLPLALEVVGSLLHRRKAKVWSDVIKKLKEAPHQDVQQKLKLSYDALDVEQQEIFLDIACFFIGAKKSNAVYMWEAAEFYPNHGIEVLISMSLIKLNEKKCFLMHDQLRDLGRAIVNVNSKDVRAGSRFWMHKDAVDLLKRNTGKEKVEALRLEGPSGYLDRVNFVGLEKLRFLELTKCADFGGGFGSLFPKLRWLSLRDASSFSMSNLCLRELVVLELSWCIFDETWPGWGQILISEQLKVLTLSHCNELMTTPDLSKIVNLERLVLKYCDKLTYMHGSVGKLQWLRRLTIIECDSLVELPEDLTSLGSLKQIFLRYNVMALSPSPLNLPESIGCLVSLTSLELERAANLPNSIGQLVKLKHLSLRGSKKLRVLPDSIGDLRSLVSLVLFGSGITELPTTIGRLAKLESLCLSNCKGLQILPESIVNLHSLIDMDMSNTCTAELPRLFGNLVSLQKLNLMGSHVTSMPDSFTGLEKLERLDIGGLSLRASRNFYTGGNSSWAESIRGLEELERLKIGNGRETWIRELQALPSGLTWLRVTCVEKMKNLSDLMNLSHLEIGNPVSKRSVVLEGFENLIKLKRLDIYCSSVTSLSMDQWGALQQLKRLTLGCPSLKFRQCQLPSNIESLDLHVKKWGKLPSNLSSMKNLRELKLGNFVIKEADWSGECLEVLEMRNCFLKFNEFPVLKRLRNLHIDGCRSQFQLKLSNLKNLSKLELTYFTIRGDDHQFKALGAEGLESSIVELVMNDCVIVEFTSNFSVLKSLKSLRLYLKRCSFPTITCLDIPHLNRLVCLDISCCDDLVDIQGIEKLKSLTQLCISNCDSLRRIEDLSELSGLTSVDIYMCKKFEGIDNIDTLLSVGTLSIDITECKCDNIRSSSSARIDEDEEFANAWSGIIEGLRS